MRLWGKSRETAELSVVLHVVARACIVISLAVTLPGAGWAGMSADVLVSVIVGDPLQDSTDLDADGIPDYWEYQYFQNLTTVSADSDYDQDGFLDREECLAGTAPNNPSSLLEIETLSFLPGGQVVLKWTSSSSTQPQWRSYDIYFADSVSSLIAGGTAVQMDIPSQGDLTQVQFPGEDSSRRFFRIKLHQ
jgi:hypothetical protein